MKLPILMYHKIDELPAGVRTPGNFVSPALFAEHMDALLAWGYHTVGFDQWLDYVHQESRPPAQAGHHHVR